MSNTEAWTFPAVHGIKAIGLSGDPIADILEQILVQQQLKHFGKLTAKLSTKGKYVSVTARVHFASKDQVDSLFAALHAHPNIIQSL